MADFQIFRNSVRATPSSGSGGTQSNELEAKIKLVTSSTTIGSTFIYDTRSDSDGGAWRKKARGSWYYETLNTATRGGRREFPSVALIVADNDSSTRTVTIYDLDDPAMPMWMVINGGGGHILYAADMGSVFALNGRLYVGHNASIGALSEISFADDFGFVRINSTSEYNGATIADREGRNSDTVTGTTGALVNRTVNDVAATIVEGAEIGALGLPIPTIAVACGSGSSGGVSVIHPNGDVYSKTTTGVNVTRVEWSQSGLNVSQNDYIARFAFSELYASGSGTYPSSFVNNGTIQIIRQNGTAPSPNLLDGTNNDEGFVCTGGDDFATGSPDGLSLVKWNNGNPADGAVAYITSDYNTGYMLGDIRFAGLANNKVTDRSVKANTLTQNGSVGSADVATGAELKAYNGFSTSNYLTRASADLGTTMDLGTTATVMAWVKVVAGSTYQSIINHNSTTLGQGWQLLIDSSEQVYFGVYGANGTYSSGLSSTLTTGVWHQIVGVNTGSQVQVYVDGKLANSSTAATGSMNNGSANLNIGIHYNHTSYPFLGSISLARVSATVATPQQVKDIYEAEKPLFQAGAKCLLQSNSATPNVVNDLSYDPSTDILSVAQSANNEGGINYFRGLELVDTFNGTSHGWNFAVTSNVSTNGGVVAGTRTAGTGGVLVDLPAIDVRGDINTADTKLPDDGKFHFTGVTTDATPTVIGQIPIAENEWYSVKARVTSIRHNTVTSNAYNTITIEETFYRDIGGNVVSRGQIRKLSDEVNPSLGLDADLAVDSGPQTIQVKVTGYSGAGSMQWNATVEVQRISEKQYER